VDKTDKEARLANRVAVGDRMRGFAADPLISAWFDKAIENQTNAMVDAASRGDEKAMMHAGLSVKVINEVRQAMLHAEAEGRRASEEIAKRRKRSEQ
jgi:hypothetical protein